MMAATHLRLHARILIAAAFCSAGLLLAQEPSTSTFYDVQLTKDEVYSYTNLKFAGDYASFESPRGMLVLGRTGAGVTVVMILGQGSFTLEAPEAVQEKFTTVFGAYPLKSNFKNLYIRLHPKEFEEAFAKQSLTKVADEGAFNSAKEMFDERFALSYHAGSKALLPPYKTRVLEFTTAEHGLISTQEGYWLILRKYSPYGSVYPSNFVNPKQK